MRAILVIVCLLICQASANAKEIVSIGPPMGDAAPAGVIMAPPEAQTVGTEAHEQFLRALSIMGAALVIGGEKACKLNYDKGRIDAFIDKDAAPRDKTFHKQVLKQAGLIRPQAKSWSASTIASICPDIKAIAHDNGLID